MPATSQTADLLKLQTEVWKTRAHAKQKELERTLAEPARSTGDARRQTMWIKQALDVVKRGQEELKYQTALLDIYTEHLNALEMSLLAANERRAAGNGSAKDHATSS